MDHFNSPKGNENIVEYLTQRDVKPTPNRILVMGELLKAKSPVSLADLETALESVDKASIFRVLELFAEKDLVHVISDGSRSLKYEACHGDQHSISDQHVHFYCEKCKKVYCFEDIKVPEVEIPESFKVKSTNFMLSGICPKCQ